MSSGVGTKGGEQTFAAPSIGRGRKWRSIWLWERGNSTKQASVGVLRFVLASSYP